MNKKIYALLVVVLMAVSLLSVICNAKAESAAALGERKIGNIHVDASAFLQDLGYSDSEIANISSKLKVQILRSFDTAPVLQSDGDYYLKIDSNTPRAPVNIIGTDKISPTDIDFSGMPNVSANVNSTISSDSMVSPETLLSQRACLFFAIWDYPGTSYDLPGVQTEYNAVTSDIATTSAYDYWHFMTNQQCTYDMVRLWITWACATYQNVDVYWDGHGTQVWGETAYVPYNYWDNNGNTNTSALYFADDFTTGTYDYSPLRVGMGSFCYGYAFGNTFRNPGGAVTHDRIFIGPTGVVLVAYTQHYMEKWGDCWYHNYENSADAHTHALSYAATYQGTGCPFSINTINLHIWFR